MFEAAARSENGIVAGELQGSRLTNGLCANHPTNST